MSIGAENNNVQRLMSLMRASKEEYQLYLSNGRTFRHAKALRQNNQKILDLVNGADFDADSDLTSALLELADHLQDWSRCWDRESEARSPDDDDEFVFTGYKTYPKHLDPLLQAHVTSTDT